MRTLYSLKKRKETRRLPSGKVNNVLVIYLSGVGDTVMIVSCLKEIRNHHPSAKISFLASSQNHDIVTASPHLSHIFCLDKTKGACCFIRSLFNCLKAFRRTEYDVMIDFEQFLRLSAIICLLSQAKSTFGFKTRNQFRHHAYTGALRFDPSTHTLNNFCALLGLLGIDHGPNGLERISVSEEDEIFVRKLLAECGISNGDMVVGIHTGSGGTATSRRWEPAKFSALADLLVENYGAKVVLTGTKDEKQVVESIVSGIKNMKNCHNLAGRLTLAQLPCLISRCNTFVTNDTGPLHIAAAMDVPTVALMGPNTPARYAPIGNKHRVIYKAVDCSPCIIAHEGVVPYCKDNICMQEITVEEVWEALESILSSLRASP